MGAETTPQSGFGTALTWAGHDMGYMQDISGPNITRDVITLEHHDLTDGFRGKLPGLADGGEVSFEVLMITGDTTGQKYFLTDLTSGTERQVIITLPDNSTWTFNAIGTGFAPSDPVNDKLTATLRMAVNGKPVYAAAT